MQIAVDALSATNLSARRVLLGHLNAIAKAHLGTHHFIVLYHRNNRDLVCNLGSNVSWHQCPWPTRHWAIRWLWQQTQLAALLRSQQVEVIINPTGALIPGLSSTQIVLAQNPWCFVPAFHRNFGFRLKAALQRRAYRIAQTRAHVLFCNSTFLATLYAHNAKGFKRKETILANGIDEAIYEAAQPIAPWEARELEVLTVSVMTPHKAIETVIDAHALLHQKGIRAKLRLVGPWAVPGYRLQMERRIASLGLKPWVTIHGRVSDHELHAYYRRARVFALLSRCESFGLPAVEAQAFGTPSVVADVGAPPEIAGPGGLIVFPDDPKAASVALENLLVDHVLWARTSKQAIENAERFRWDRVSKPLVQCLDTIGLVRARKMRMGLS